MRGLFIHAVIYAVINALLVGVWLLTTGSTTELSHVRDDPILAIKNGFWLLIVIAAWGGALVIHASFFVGSLLPGSQRARARRKKRHEMYRKAIERDRERRRDRERHHRPRPGEPEPSSDIGKQAAQAAIGLVETLTGRVASRPS